MDSTSFFSAQSRTRLLQGAAIGAVATIIIGFYFGGWTTAGSVNQIAKIRADAAVVAAFAPSCAVQLKARPDGTAIVDALKKVTTGWERRSVFKDKNAEAIITLPGESYPSTELAQACADAAFKSQSAAVK